MLYLQIFTKQLEPPLILQVAKRESSNCADEEQNGSTARAKISLLMQLRQNSNKPKENLSTFISGQQYKTVVMAVKDVGKYDIVSKEVGIPSLAFDN